MYKITFICQVLLWGWNDTSLGKMVPLWRSWHSATSNYQRVSLNTLCYANGLVSSLLFTPHPQPHFGKGKVWMAAFLNSNWNVCKSLSPVALAGRLRAYCHFYIKLTVMQKSIVVQYPNKFIHGFGKFLIVLLCSLLSSLLLYSIVMWGQYNTMPGINLSEYWTSSLQKSSGRHWEKYHNSLVKFFF